MMGMSLLVAVAVALSLSSTIIAGGDCPAAHIDMTMEAACREATAGMPMPMYKLCMVPLEKRCRAGSIHKASEYASIAAVEVWPDYPFIMSFMRSALINSSIADEAKTAYELCSHSYHEADASMDRVWKRLPESCGLDLGDEYRAALRTVGACKDSLAKLPNLPLLNIVEDNYNRTMVAYLLGKLIGIK